MSSYTNANYGLPPIGKLNIVNGMPPVTQVQQQQLPPQQQQPFSGIPSMPPSINANMSKFMPPSMTSTPSTTPITSPGNYASPQIVNGPEQRPPINQHPTQGPLTCNLPPHMRPPIANGPGSGNNLMSNGASTNATASANSSRTASPSMQFNQQQQPYPSTAQPLQQQFKPILPSGIANQPLKSSATNSTVTSTVNNLTGSMQNLNINRIIGPPTTLSSSQSMQLPSTLQQQQVNNFQVRFNK